MTQLKLPEFALVVLIGASGARKSVICLRYASEMKGPFR